MGTDKKINVCHLISGDLWAGAEVQMFTLVAALKSCPELNISAIVLNNGKLANKLREIEIDTTVIDESKNGFYKILNKAKKRLENAGIDILHSHRYKENILGALLKKKGLARCLVQTVHGTGERFKGFALFKARIYSAANRFYTRRYFDRAIAVSDDIKNKLQRFMPESCLTTIHNAVDPKAIKPSNPPDIIRREFDIDGKAPIIGVIGRMVPVKAYDLFLRAAKEILEDRPDARFMLVGEGPLKPTLQELSVQLKIADKVIFPGFRDDILDIMNAFDIFAISSYHEGVPMALLEAMSLKKSVVSTAVGGINEVIEDGVSGLLVEPNSDVSLARACLEVLNDSELKSTIENGAYARIEEKFNTDVLSKEVLDLYRELVR